MRERLAAGVQEDAIRVRRAIPVRAGAEAVLPPSGCATRAEAVRLPEKQTAARPAAPRLVVECLDRVTRDFDRIGAGTRRLVRERNVGEEWRGGRQLVVRALLQDLRVEVSHPVAAEREDLELDTEGAASAEGHLEVDRARRHVHLRRCPVDADDIRDCDGPGRGIFPGLLGVLKRLRRLPLTVAQVVPFLVENVFVPGLRRASHLLIVPRVLRPAEGFGGGPLGFVQRPV